MTMHAKTRKVTSIGDTYARIVMYSSPRSETGQAACNKCANGEKQHIPIARIEILFVSQFANLMCALFLWRMRNLFSVDSRTERKRVPDNARKGTKVTKTGHF